MKLIIDIDEEVYKRFAKAPRTATLDECMSERKVLVTAITNGTPIPDNATPCDFCRYNPPSSTDGKPCCVCPAIPCQKGGK